MARGSIGLRSRREVVPAWEPMAYTDSRMRVNFFGAPSDLRLSSPGTHMIAHSLRRRPRNDATRPTRCIAPPRPCAAIGGGTALVGSSGGCMAAVQCGLEVCRWDDMVRPSGDPRVALARHVSRRPV